MKKIYLDYNATTPVRAEAAEIVNRCMTEKFGNASSIHSFGREAREIMEKARENVAGLINALPEEIYFTSGGTESDNLAIKGVLKASEKKDAHIITSAIEHPAVLSTCRVMENEGYKVTYIIPDGTGIVEPEEIRKAVTDETLLVSIMHANNEVGSIQPIKEIGGIISAINEKRSRDKKQQIYFHTDTVQTTGKLPIDVNAMNIGLLSISGHKLYGPKGVGALYIRKGTELAPLITGGHHERNIRPGTENVPGIAGFGEAIRLAKKEMAEEREKIFSLKRKLYEGITSSIDEVLLNGDFNNSLPNTLNLSFGYIEGEAVVINLDLKGIAISSGSACSSGSTEPSHVLLSMGLDPVRCRGAVRFSLGKYNDEEEIGFVIEELKGIIKRLRDISPIYKRKSK